MTNPDLYPNMGEAALRRYFQDNALEGYYPLHGSAIYDTAAGGGDPLDGVSLGDAFMDGYYAGIVDTTQGNIDAADVYQTGRRFALIVSPVSLRSTSYRWRSSLTAYGTTAGFRTRWDGLESTLWMISEGAAFEAAGYCNGLTYPADGASQWYLPAMDELSLVYRNLKPTTASNSTGAYTPAFPGTSEQRGTNPSSDPVSTGYLTSDPTQTAAALFQDGGGQHFTPANFCLSATGSGGSSGTNYVRFSDGFQTWADQNLTGLTTRPVRRFYLDV